MTATASASDAMVSDDGVEFFVRERGQGRPVVIINGLGGLAEMLEPIRRKRCSAFTATSPRAPRTEIIFA